MVVDENGTGGGTAHIAPVDLQPAARRRKRGSLPAQAPGFEFLGLDAQDCLNRFMVAGLPDPQLFELTIGALVRSRAKEGVRAYGEMVALLWQQDNLAGTVELEALWNGLQRETDFDLLCAYPIQDVEGREGLADICDLHTEVLPLAS